jgi:L-gulonolactone oxidase
VIRCAPEADPDTFRAAQVGLGALGVISTVTLQVCPAFNLEAVEGEADLDETLDGLDELVEANEHFEFFWFPHTSKVYAKRNNRTDKAPTPRSAWKDFRNDILLSNVAFGAACMVGKRQPRRIPWIAQNVVASQLGRMRKVDRSDLIFTSPRLVRFAEMEYAIPRADARAAIEGLRAVIDERGLVTNFPVEVRFVAPDDILLSPSHGRETCYIAVHLYRGMDYEPYFRAVEELMMSFGGRPHWGKLHFRDADSLRGVYPRFEDFLRVRDRLDPQGRFRNPYLDRVLGLT